MKKKISISILILLPPLSTLAQNISSSQESSIDVTNNNGTNTNQLKTTKHRIITSFGIGLSDERDLLISQLFRFGVSGKISLGYEYFDSFQYHLVHLSGGYGNLFKNYTDSNSKEIIANEDILFHANLVQSSQFFIFENNILQLYLGFVLDLSIEFWISDYLAYSWSAHILIGPALTGIWQRGPHQIKGSFLLPMLGSQSRPAFNGINIQLEKNNELHGFLIGGLKSIIENSSFAFWHNFFWATLHFDYRYTFHHHIDFLVNYAISGEYRNLPHAKQSKLKLQHNLLVGFIWKW